jgi:alanine racemase
LNSSSELKEPSSSLFGKKNSSPSFPAKETQQSLTVPQGNDIPAHATSVLEIDLDAISYNYSYLSELLDSSQCSAVVKADAYGLGMAAVAARLAQKGCNAFFVAHIDEGIFLRSLLKEASIYVLSGIIPGSEAILHHHRLIPVLNNFGQLERWRALSLSVGQPLPAILHFDTGMARNGFDQADFKKLIENISWIEDIDIHYFFSHLACSEDPNHFMNLQQLKSFQSIQKLLPKKPICFANSGGIFLGKNYHYQLARPGKALYGMHPMGDAGHQGENRLKPVIHLKARIMQIRNVSKKQTVGYNCTHTFHRDSRLAILSIGYADGYYRHLSNRGWVHFDSFKAPLVGNVSMDYIVVDITDVPEGILLKEGGWAEVIGAYTTPTALTEPASTLAREFLTHLGGRHHRIYKTKE